MPDPVEPIYHFQGPRKIPAAYQPEEGNGFIAFHATVFFIAFPARQELIKAAIRSFGKPLKRFDNRAISPILAMNREANENKDNSRHPLICYFEQFLPGPGATDKNT